MKPDEYVSFGPRLSASEPYDREIDGKVVRVVMLGIYNDRASMQIHLTDMPWDAICQLAEDVQAWRAAESKPVKT